MKQHYTLNNFYTKEMFEKHKETIYPPEMYSLEENEMTLGDCFVRKILWIIYFKEKGYVPLNHEDDVSSSDNLFEENIPEYERMKDLDVNEIICASNRKFSRYGRERRLIESKHKCGERKQVKFFCSQEEYEMIKNNASKCDKTVSAFIRDVSVNTVSINYNYDAIIEHTNEINRIRAELHAIITMLVKTNQAFPNDIEKMIELLQKPRYGRNMILLI